MRDPLAVDLFAEDRAHEAFLAPLIGRCADEVGRPITLNVRTARGGHPRVLEELELYQQSVTFGIIPAPDLLVVAIDANCQQFTKARDTIMGKVIPRLIDQVVTACPDPHIERWYLADPDSFETVVGSRPAIAEKKCKKDYYKAALAQAVIDAGHPSTLQGIEFAEEIVSAMDLYRAGRNEGSLKHFTDGISAKLKSR